MAEKMKVPEIRFKGFEEKWEEKELCDEVEFYSGLTYSPSNVIKAGGTFVLRSSNVKNGEIVNADDVYVDSNVVNCDNVKEGDIVVVVRNGSRSLIGKHAQIKVRMNNTVIGAFMTGIRSKQSTFINALLDTQQFYSEVEKNLGATINQITNGMFREMNFMFPCIEEQSQIGTYFQNLDKLITLHQRKHDKLITLKKAMLEKMFPKNGADVPEIRFKGFEGKWEKRKLGEIKDVRDGTHDSPKYVLNGYPLVTSKNLSNEGLDLSDVSYISNYDYIEINKRSKVDIGDIIFGMIGTIGNPVLVSRNDFAIKNVALIKKGGEVSNFFLIQLLKSSIFDSYIKAEYSGSTQAFLGLSKIREFIFCVPLISEQTQIGTYFQNLDKLISLHQKELEKLKNIKKACLEKMFV